MTDLQEAFREAARREFSMVPDESELDYTFSPGFQRKMQRIILAQVHGYWNMVNTLGKRIAIAAAIIVMLLTTAMAIKPIRERVIQFFVKIYEEYFEITFGEEESGDLYSVVEPMTQYTLSWLPTGYSNTSTLETEVLVNTIWENNNGSIISLFQTPATNTLTVDHKNGNLSEIPHDNLSIRHQINNGASEFIWEQYGYIFQLTVHDNIPTDVILQMIVSLEIINQ